MMTPAAATEAGAPERPTVRGRAGVALWAAALLLLSIMPLPVRADGAEWVATIARHEGIPPLLVAVDKKRQQIFLFESRSPLRLKNTYICTTGQAVGDKMVRGDLKTPEGVYFVVQRLTAGLDFTMYGNEAYTLNYPNPVDRLRSKTGYGIWIHGRGEPIAPLQTQGCIAMNNPDLAGLGRSLPPGTPVMLTASFSQADSADAVQASVAHELTAKVRAWAEAWGGRSPKMFGYYDPQSYSLATESFSAFKTQKERLFKNLPWIKTSVENIQVLEGPGYWVTWFQQDYTASNLSTRGVRRLYWQKINGELRIVGMEWVPGMTAGTLLASAEPAVPPIETTPHTEEQDDRAAAAVPPAPAPTATSTSSPAKGVEPTAPANAAATAPATPVPPAGAAKTEEPEGRSLPEGVTTTLTEAAQAKPIVPETKPMPTAKAEDPAKGVRAALETWRKAWEKGDLDDYMACYAKDADQSGRKGAAAIRAQKKKLWVRCAPAEVELTGIAVSVSGHKARAEMRQIYRDAGDGGDKGIKTLVLEHRQNTWLIVRENWRPAR